MFFFLTAPSFGDKHLLGILYVVFLISTGVFLFGKKSSKKEILIITIIFYVLEVLKIGYLIIRDGGYPMNHLPLHLCSMPLYTWLILYLSKEGSKLEQYALATAFVTSLGGGIAALAIPGNIIGNEESWTLVMDNFLPLVSFTFHGLMIMSSVYLLSSGKYKPMYLDALRTIIFTLGLMILALIVNALIDADYMLLNKGNGSPFKFVLEQHGQIPYTLTMIVVGMVVIGFISMISTVLYKLVERIKG